MPFWLVIACRIEFGMSIKVMMIHEQLKLEKMAVIRNIYGGFEISHLSLRIGILLAHFQPMMQAHWLFTDPTKTLKERILKLG